MWSALVFLIAPGFGNVRSHSNQTVGLAHFESSTVRAACAACSICYPCIPAMRVISCSLKTDPSKDLLYGLIWLLPRCWFFSQSHSCLNLGNNKLRSGPCCLAKQHLTDLLLSPTALPATYLPCVSVRSMQKLAGMELLQLAMYVGASLKSQLQLRKPAPEHVK